MKRKTIIALIAFAALFTGSVVIPPTLPAAAADQPAAMRLNPNTATEAQLRALPQVNDAIFAAIQQGKPFATIGAFNTALTGKLNADQTRALFEVLFVPINLNTASRADIMLVPGMTARMAHEFEEYRPYTNIEQFNREIGKYVNAAEVARLRSYVTLN
jgi:DNA uptake protein ComE-like DNA-binding protein